MKTKYRIVTNGSEYRVQRKYWCMCFWYWDDLYRKDLLGNEVPLLTKADAEDFLLRCIKKDNEENVGWRVV